jgi:hypothetical protein
LFVLTDGLALPLQTLLYHVLPKQYSAEELLGIQPAELSTLLTNATIAVGKHRLGLGFVATNALSFLILLRYTTSTRFPPGLWATELSRATATSQSSALTAARCKD